MRTAEHVVAPAARLLPRTSRGRWLVVALLGLALVLRVAVVLENRAEYKPATDARHFDLIATNITEGKGYEGANLPPTVGPSAIRAPGYPVLLAGVYLVFGDHAWTAGRLVNAGLGTVLVALIGLLAAQLWSRREGLVALAVAAVYPPLILVGSSLQLEPLLVVLSLATLAAALEHRRRPAGLMWPATAGALLGLTVLTREIGFALVLPVVLLVWWRGERRPGFDRASLQAPLALLAAATLVVMPWTVRNAIQLDEFVPVTTSAGFGLAGTYNETSYADSEHPAQWIEPYADPEVAEIMTRDAEPTEVELDGELRDFTVDFVREHPGYPLKVAFWNTVRMFDLDGGEYSRFIARFLPYPRYLTNLSVLAGYLLGALAVAGAFAPLTRRVPRPVWLAPALTYVGLVVLLPGSIRYRASLEPFAILAATALVAWAADRFVAPRRAWAAASAD